MAGYCSTGQSAQRAVVLMEEEEDFLYRTMEKVYPKELADR
jgi:hypothetical protein